jgi:hypothetical protein
MIALVFTVSTVLKSLILVLESMEKRGILRPQYKSYPPEATASALSRWFFTWINPLFRRGFSNLLVIDDLFSLDKHLLSDRTHEHMQASWSKGT